MALFTTKKPKKGARVIPMEEDDEDDLEDEDYEEEEVPEIEPPKKKVVKKKKAQPEASEEELEVSGEEKAPELTSTDVIDILNQIDARLTRLERHSILVGARD